MMIAHEREFMREIKPIIIALSAIVHKVWRMKHEKARLTPPPGRRLRKSYARCISVMRNFFFLDSPTCTFFIL